MYCPTPSAPGCSCTTCPCISFFGMTNGWWMYLACFLRTYSGYPAGGSHPPWYWMMGTGDWLPTDDTTHLPSHFLGTDTFINGSLHDSFSAMWPSLVPGNQTIPGSMYLARAASGERVLLKCLKLSYNTPQNTCAIPSAPTFSSWSLIFSNPNCTASTPRLCGTFIPRNISRNKE